MTSRRHHLLPSLAAVSALLLSACASPGPAAPPPVLRDAAALGAQGAFSSADWPQDAWWTAFGDPALDALVQRALASQPGLAAAQARVQRAQALQAAGTAALGPQLDLRLEATDQRFTAKGVIPPPLAGATGWTALAQVGAAWSPDLAGGRRAALQAAIGQRRAAEADAQAARVLLAGQVAAGHFRLAALLDQRRVIDAALAQREQVAALVHERRSAGLDTEIERQQAGGLVAQARAQQAALDEAIARARHALAELSGQGPMALDAYAPLLAELRPLPTASTLPADLLGRRADLVAACWRVEASLQGVAMAAPDEHRQRLCGGQRGADHAAGAGTVVADPGRRHRLREGRPGRWCAGPADARWHWSRPRRSWRRRCAKCARCMPTTWRCRRPHRGCAQAELGRAQRRARARHDDVARRAPLLATGAVGRRGVPARQRPAVRHAEERAGRRRRRRCRGAASSWPPARR
jgi:hypothetical protein